MLLRVSETYCFPWQCGGFIRECTITYTLIDIGVVSTFFTIMNKGYGDISVNVWKTLSSHFYLVYILGKGSSIYTYIALAHSSKMVVLSYTPIST